MVHAARCIYAVALSIGLGLSSATHKERRSDRTRFDFASLTNAIVRRGTATGATMYAWQYQRDADRQGNDCDKRPGGDEGCCSGNILKLGRSCNNFTAPCVLEQVTVRLEDGPPCERVAVGVCKPAFGQVFVCSMWAPCLSHVSRCGLAPPHINGVPLMVVGDGGGGGEG